MFMSERLCKKVQMCYFGWMTKSCLLAVCLVVTAVIATVPTVLAPPAGQRIFFATGDDLHVRWHEVSRNEVVLTLADGQTMVTDPNFIIRIEPDDVKHSQARPVSESASQQDKPYAELIERASALHGVDPSLVYALIEVESGYRPDAESPRGAMGLMQLMPETAIRYAVQDPFDPAANIDAGTRHLRILLDEFGTRGALAAYNAGEGPVRAFDGVPPYSETRKYVTRVLDIAAQPVQIR
tara:strand:- start:5175 stop:5891 length:717 start_codon:yes stop_codon:yes gene_type:complete